MRALIAVPRPSGGRGARDLRHQLTLAPGSFLRFGASPVQPTSGSFVYDAATTTFSNFVVNYGGIAWDLTQSANSPTGFSQCAGLANTAANAFALLAQTLPCSPVYRWGGGTGSLGFFFGIEAYFPGPPVSAFGLGPSLPGPAPVPGPGTNDTGGFTITAVPEPATFGVLLAVLFCGGALVRRRH